MASSLTIQQIAGGPLETNAYLIIDPDAAAGLLVDTPPETHDAVVAAVEAARVDVRAIVLTHTHWDHIVDANALRTSLGAPILAHPEADRRLASPASAVMTIPYTIEPVTPDGHLEDGDAVTLGAHVFEVLIFPDTTLPTSPSTAPPIASCSVGMCSSPAAMVAPTSRDPTRPPWSTALPGCSTWQTMSRSIPDTVKAPRSATSEVG